MNVIGLDIGGTKCAVTLSRCGEASVEILAKESFLTVRRGWREVCCELCDSATRLSRENGAAERVGISVGGPMSSARGMILSPPNLPGWDDVPVCAYFADKLGIPAYAQNDANACALAEWLYGAGRGAQNMVFLTFGTGLGAGLILNGRLYAGTNDMAGEAGHVRLAPFGPAGYGKAGTFEGWCSGGGIAQLARLLVSAAAQRGERTVLPSDIGLTARDVAEAAKNGDAVAMQIYETVGEKLGEGISVLIDLFNPQVIVIGSIYARSHALMEPAMYRAISREALPMSAAVCDIRPAALGETLGDVAAACVAVYGGTAAPTLGN